MLIDWILAFLPILVMLILMVRFHWGAQRAGPVGWMAAMLVAWLRFGARFELLAFSHGKSFLLTLDVLLIVWAAFLLFRVADEAGAIKIIGQALPRLTADKGMQAGLIGWTFASFLQGVGGFGVPVAVTAPLLAGLGFSSLAAVVIPSLGHAWAVTFGSLASSFQALMAATGLPGPDLAPSAAILLGLTAIGCGLMVMHAADGWRAVRRLLVPVVLIGLIMGGAQYLLATHGLWNIGGFGGGLAGLAFGVILSRWYRGNPGTRSDEPLDLRKLLLAVSGYATLVFITLIIQLIPAVKEALGGLVIRLEFPVLETVRGHLTPAGPGRVIHLLNHAGAILGCSSLIAYWIYRSAGLYAPGAAGRIVRGTIRRTLPSSIGIASMVAMAVVMTHAGMTDALARGLAAVVGGAFPLVSPWIGALGAFITGSNTNSNVIFAVLQMRTAELLGFSVAWVLAGQTSGGAVGSVIAPTKVIVGASTAGMAGKEGEVMRALLRYVPLLILGLSLVVWLFIRFSVPSGGFG